MYLFPVLIGSALFTSAMNGQSTLVVVLLHSFENLTVMMMMMMMMKIKVQKTVNDQSCSTLDHIGS